MSTLEKTTNEPDYILVAHMVFKIEDYKKFQDEVNDYIKKGYVPFGSIADDHNSDYHTDVVQPMVKPWILKAGHE